jgi:hypothetical protein
VYCCLPGEYYREVVVSKKDHDGHTGTGLKKSGETSTKTNRLLTMEKVIAPLYVGGRTVRALHHLQCLRDRKCPVSINPLGY